MAKKKHTLGKLLAFTTAVAAIGGTCYIFRDKIKTCPLYQKAADKLSGLKGSISDKFSEDEDFFFDDDDFEDESDDIFADTEHGREYTSITINAKEHAEGDTSAEDTEIPDTADSDTATATAGTSSNNSVEEEVTLPEENMTEISEHTDVTAKNDTVETIKESTEPVLEEVIPTISFGNPFGSSEIATEEKTNENASAAEVTDYENEGLSDVSEDPDTLEDQDKLDF